MRYEDAQLLRQWALMQFDRVCGKVPPLERTAERHLIHKSKGFRVLREWFTRMSPAAKVRARSWMRQQLHGVRAAIAAAAQHGEILTAADIEDINYIVDMEDTDGTERDDTKAGSDRGSGGDGAGSHGQHGAPGPDAGSGDDSAPAVGGVSEGDGSPPG